jgi:hypothetical protein
MRNSSRAKLSGRPSSDAGNSTGRATCDETCALNSSTGPSEEASAWTARAWGRGSPSVDMPSVMLMTSGG